MKSSNKPNLSSILEASDMSKKHKQLRPPLLPQKQQMMVDTHHEFSKPKRATHVVPVTSLLTLG